METTNPATRAMDSFHAVLVFYLTEPVHLVMMTKWFYGTILRRDVGIVLIRATQTIYWYETRDLNNSALFFLSSFVFIFCFFDKLTMYRSMRARGGGRKLLNGRSCMNCENTNANNFGKQNSQK